MSGFTMNGKCLAVLFVVLLLVGSLAVACGQTEEPDVDDPSADEPPAEQDPDDDDDDEYLIGDVLILAQGSDPLTMAPQEHRNSATAAVQANVFEGLIYHGTFDQPLLAHDWEQVDDFTWKFYLRDDVVFHDGEPFTAVDVKYTFEDLQRDNERSPSRGTWEDRLSHVEIVDDFTVKFHLNTIVPPQVFFTDLGSYAGYIVPKHYHEEVGPEYAAANPIGTGPYVVAHWARDDRMELEFFEDHWRVFDPVFKKAIHRAIPEASTRMAEVMTGGVHFTLPIPTTEYERIAHSDYADPIRMDTTRILHWEMYHGLIDGEPAATADLRVRQAIDYAIDNQTLVDAVLDGFGVPVMGYFGEDLGGGNQRMFGTIPGMDGEYRFDIDRAKELLSEAGYAEGELAIHVDGCRGRYPHDSDVSEIVAEAMLPLAGINTTLRILDWGPYNQEVRTPGGMTHMALSGHSPGLDVGTGMLGRFRRHYAWQEYQNDEMFDLLYRACETAEGMDAEHREALIQEAQQIAMEDLPEIRLYRVVNLYARHRGLDWDPPLSENTSFNIWQMARR